MAARRRSMEEKNLKILRELAALPTNKQCFDCHQRGPTYINMTLGSFVCTSCSGILRGLTPPHRVKSITMTTFTVDEIEFLKTRGNEYCRYVWMGTYDSRTCNTENDIKDDHKKRELMSQKYEKKRWYVDPEIAQKKLKHDLQLQPKPTTVSHNPVPSSNSTMRPYTRVPEVQPLSQLFGRMPTALVVDNNQQPTETWPHPVSSATASTISTVKNTSQHKPESHAFDLLSELGGIPSTNTTIGNSNANGNFANFDSAFSSPQKPVSGNTTTAGLPSSMSMDNYPGFSLTSKDSIFSTMMPSSGPMTAQPSTTTLQESAQDRYAALADLDNSFNFSGSSSAASSVTSPSWSVKSTSTAMTAAMTTTTSNYSSAPSNPFASTPGLWSSQIVPSKANVPTSANPFQSVQEGGSLPFHQNQMSGQGFTPLPIVGNSPTEDCFRTQFATTSNFFAPFGTGPDVSSPPNGYHGGQYLAQNGDFASMTLGRPNWGISPSPSLPLAFSTSQHTSALEKNATDMYWHSDQMPNPANPFAGSRPMSGPPQPSQSNPFL